MPIRLGMNYEQYGEEPPKYPRFMANRPVTSMGAPVGNQGQPLLPEVAEKVIGYKGAPPDQVQKSPGFIQSLYRKIQGIDPRVKHGILGALGTPATEEGFWGGLEAGVRGFTSGASGYEKDLTAQRAAASKAQYDQSRAQAAETTASANMLRATAYDRWVDRPPRPGAMTIKDKIAMWMTLSPEEKQAYNDMRRQERPRTLREENEDQLVESIQAMAMQASGYEMPEEEARLLARAKPSLVATTTSLEKRDPATGKLVLKGDPLYKKTFPQMVNKRQFALPGVIKQILKKYGLKAEDYYGVLEGYETPEDVYPSDSSAVGEGGVDAFGGSAPDSINAGESISAGPQSREQVMQTEDVETLYDWLSLEEGLTDEQAEWINEKLFEILRANGSAQ